MTEYIENPLSGKLRGVTYEDGKIINVHIRDTDDVVKVFVPMASEKEATGMMDVREKTASEKRLEEMSEYIKKDELLKFKADVYDEDGHVLYAVPTGCIVAMPPADVVLVRHGRWEEMHYEGGILDGTNFDRCSVCGYERVFDDPAFKTVFKYCPNCGAKMDGGAE